MEVHVVKGLVSHPLQWRTAKAAKERHCMPFAECQGNVLKVQLLPPDVAPESFLRCTFKSSSV